MTCNRAGLVSVVIGQVADRIKTPSSERTRSDASWSRRMLAPAYIFLRIQSSALPAWFRSVSERARPMAARAPNNAARRVVWRAQNGVWRHRAPCARPTNPSRRAIRASACACQRRMHDSRIRPTRCESQRQLRPADACRRRRTIRCIRTHRLPTLQCARRRATTRGSGNASSDRVRSFSASIRSTALASACARASSAAITSSRVSASCGAD